MLHAGTMRRPFFTRVRRYIEKKRFIVSVAIPGCTDLLIVSFLII